MVRDETVAATYVENVYAGRKKTSDFEGHVVRAAHFASSSHPAQTSFDSGERSWHRPVHCNDSASTIRCETWKFCLDRRKKWPTRDGVWQNAFMTKLLVGLTMSLL